jgi:carbonic anhydrase/acetyltransferase-like protein (isoleucine patch superfamily)
MSSPTKFLKSLIPNSLKQMMLRARFRSRGCNVSFGPGARIDTFVDFAGNSSLGAGATVFGSNVGRWTYLGDQALAINCEIGAFCSIAAKAVIGGGNHPTRDYVTTSPLFYGTIHNPWGIFPGSMQRDTELPRTRIGNDVWIGYSAIVLPGKRVGDGAIIAAGAVVTHDVEPYEIVAGVPARSIRTRFDPDDVEWLLSIGWWNWPDERLKQLRPMFRSIESLRAAVNTSATLVAAGTAS